MTSILLIAGILTSNLAAGQSDDLYQIPEATDNGFLTAAPEDVGLDRKPLEELTGLLRDDIFPNVHALLIQKNGRLVYEEYFNGTDRRWSEAGEPIQVELQFDRDTLHSTRSVGKSITSALVGIAIAERRIESVNQSVFDYFPEHSDKSTRAKQQITLQHLLTMSAGLEWNEDLPYTDPANDEIQMDASDDPAGFVLSRPLVNEPGTTFNYGANAPTLLGYIVSRSSQQPFGDFAKSRLFDALEMRDVEWGGCCDGWEAIPELEWKSDKAWAKYTVPAGSLWMRPRDLLKFGSLYLNEGRWRDKQILTPDWVSSSLKPQIPTEELTLDHGTDAFSSGSYGYFWWHTQYELPYGDIIVHAAYGNGGQRIWVIPALDLLVVHMTGNYNRRGSGLQAERLLLEHIVPWAKGVDTDYQHSGGMPMRKLELGEWAMAEIDAQRYEGVWREGDSPIEITNESGILHMKRPENRSWNLLPESDSVFAFGRIVNGVPERILVPEYRLVFLSDEDSNFVNYEIRLVSEGLVHGVGKRAESSD
mgnify:FL=1